MGDGYHAWSQRYDRELDDVFTVQDEIARSVVEQLKVRLGVSNQTALVGRPTDNLEAYTLYLRGRHYFRHATAEGLQKALDSYEDATSQVTATPTT